MRRVSNFIPHKYNFIPLLLLTSCMPFTEALDQSPDTSTTSASSSSFCGGDGSIFAPLEICDRSTLINFLRGSGESSANFILTADIQLTNLSELQSRIEMFTGALNGLGHRITFPSGTYPAAFTGIFKNIGATGFVTNLTLQLLTGAHTITSTTSFGFLAVQNSGTLSWVTLQIDLSLAVTVPNGVSNFGSLVGKHEGTISACRTVGANGNAESLITFDITSGSSFSSIGGLVGLNTSQIYDCSVIGSVQEAGSPWVSDSMGGLVGQNQGTIERSFVKAIATDIKGGKWIGGFVGKQMGSGYISNSYARVKTTTANGASGNAAGFSASEVASNRITHSHADLDSVPSALGTSYCFTTNVSQDGTNFYYYNSSCTGQVYGASTMTASAYATYGSPWDAAGYDRSLWFFPGVGVNSPWPQFYAPNSEP